MSMTAIAPQAPEAATPVTDLALLRCFRSGQGDGATQLYLRYADRLRGLAKAKISPDLIRHLDVDDLVQSVFRRFFQAAQEGDYDSPTGADFWKLLMVMALNRIRTEITSHRTAKRDPRRQNPIESAAAPWQFRPSDGVQDAGLLEVVLRDALHRLPEPMQQVILLRMEGHEVAQIAQDTGRSKRAVERILQDARKNLKVLLGEQPNHADENALA